MKCRADAIENMHLEYLTLSCSSAEVEFSTDPSGSRSAIKMLATVLKPRLLYTDSSVNVTDSGFLVWVYSQADDYLDVPEDSVGAINFYKNCRASVAIAAPQFEGLQNAVLLGAHFEIQLTVNVKQKSPGPEAILYTEAFGSLPVLEVTFAAEKPQQS